MRLTSKQHYSVLRLYDAIDMIEQLVPLERTRTSMQRRRLLEKAHEAFIVHCPNLNIPAPRLSYFYDEEQFLGNARKVAEHLQHIEVFKRYYKTTPMLARQLTEQDYVQRGGSILTIEGPAFFRPGDYLERNRKGEFPIRQETMESSDYLRTSDLLQDGWAYYHPVDSRQAARQEADFSLNGQRGRAGDYIVRQVNERAYILNGELFEYDYAEETEIAATNLVVALLETGRAAASMVLRYQDYVGSLTVATRKGKDGLSLSVQIPGQDPHYSHKGLSARQIEAITYKLCREPVTWLVVI